MMETTRIPAMMAPLTRYIMSMTVRKPPQKMPTQRVGLRILSYDGQTPVSGSMFAGWQPASSSGVAVAPVMTPIPAEYVMPLNAVS